MTDILTRNRSFVIAEAGTCHADHNLRKRLDKALRYVQVAADAGADAVKFQMFAPIIQETMFCWIEGDEGRSKRWVDSIMHLSDWSVVKECAESLGLTFLASAFQSTTVWWLEELNVEATKVASRAARDFPYTRGCAPYFVSDGMYEPPERDDVIRFQCEANYPSKAVWLGETPGFSDHSGGGMQPRNAIARGCRFVEVHFYDEKKDAGPDLPASVDPEGLALICAARDQFSWVNPEI